MKIFNVKVSVNDIVLVVKGSRQYQNCTEHYVQAKYYMDKANIMMLLLFPEYYHITPSTGE